MYYIVRAYERPAVLAAVANDTLVNDDAADGARFRTAADQAAAELRTSSSGRNLAVLERQRLNVAHRTVQVAEVGVVRLNLDAVESDTASSTGIAA